MCPCKSKKRKRGDDDTLLVDLLKALKFLVPVEEQRISNPIGDCSNSSQGDGHQDLKQKDSHQAPFKLLAPSEVPIPPVSQANSLYPPLELSKNDDLHVRKLAAVLSEHPLLVKNGISDADTDLQRKCNIVISEVVQLSRACIIVKLSMILQSLLNFVKLSVK